ncbi:hypothetical protein Droror1_Dr00020887 [Drosera rotundifolia]
MRIRSRPSSIEAKGYWMIQDCGFVWNVNQIVFGLGSDWTKSESPSSPSSPSTNAEVKRSILRSDGCTSLGGRWDNMGERLLLSTASVYGTRGVISFGFPVKTLMDIFSNVESYDASLYLVTYDGEVLVQGLPKMSVTFDVVESSVSRAETERREGGREREGGGGVENCRSVGVGDLGDRITMSSFTGTQEKCKVCDKTVYVMDQLAGDGSSYHKSCFKCSHYKSRLQQEFTVLREIKQLEGKGRRSQVLVEDPSICQILEQFLLSQIQSSHLFHLNQRSMIVVQRLTFPLIVVQRLTFSDEVPITGTNFEIVKADENEAEISFATLWDSEVRNALWESRILWIWYI